MANYTPPSFADRTAGQKPRARVFQKIDAKAKAEKVQREAYAAVDARDKKRCRCCGRKGNPNATTTLGRIHRAHIQDASKGGAMAAGNLVSLCWICHALEHGKQLHVIGTNADLPAMRFEIHEAAVVDVFGARVLPKHVRIVTGPR